MMRLVRHHGAFLGQTPSIEHAPLPVKRLLYFGIGCSLEALKAYSLGMKVLRERKAECLGLGQWHIISLQPGRSEFRTTFS
jgi:hypothetical protein